MLKKELSSFDSESIAKVLGKFNNAIHSYDVNYSSTLIAGNNEWILSVVFADHLTDVDIEMLFNKIKVNLANSNPNDKFVIITADRVQNLA